MRTTRRAAVLLCAFALFAAPVARAADAAPAGRARTFAVIPFYAPERMWQLYTPFVEHLTRETGESWQLKLFPNHEAMVAGVCAGEVDVTLLGPVPLGRVHRMCGAEPFLAALGKDGSPEYRAMLLTVDPEVQGLGALRGKGIGFMKGSTAAHILPLQMLREAGLGPGSFDMVFLESQDRIMAALLAHEIDAAGVKEALYRRFEKEPSLRLVGTSRTVPNFALVALPSQPAAARERLEAALLKLRPLERPEDAAATKGWDDEIRNGFVSPAADFMPAVLGLAEITERLLNEGR